MNEERETLLQWHAAFFAGIHNIIEYKSPDDNLSIDDFYKVYGYACFYKSDTAKTNEIKITEITLSFVCSHYPRELIRHLENERGLRLEKQEEGIYYLRGDVFPIQFIVNWRLSQKENLWLKSLTNELGEGEVAQELLYEYKRHNKEKLYQSVMDIIVRANVERFKEAKKMCDALLELMKDELDEQKKEGRQEGMQEQLLDLIRKKIRKGKSLPQIADELEEACGYYGERLVLFAQQLGLNTCWVAMSYSKIKTAFVIDQGEKLTVVIALGYGETQGVMHKSKSMIDVAKSEGQMPDWFKHGVQAALLAPTAMNQQKFVFTLKGDQVSAKAGMGFYTKLDLGIVKYHFEIGAGNHHFEWVS